MWLLAVLLGVVDVGWTQGVQTGILRGVVTDQSGGALPGATVTIESPAMQGSRSVITDDSGAYVFRAIPPGDYRVTVTMPSFAG
jgi:protocatechuate 3,4-dioxygenase beta subunit